MQGFVTWWGEINTAAQVFLCAAIPATLIMLIQTILMLFGMGFGGGEDSDGIDFDGDDVEISDDFETDTGDVGVEYDPGLRIFTVRGMVAFFAIGGWVGVVSVQGGLSVVLSSILALAAGSAALVFAAMIIKWALRMQDSGNINPVNAIAHTGTVYIPIPPNRAAAGRVTLLLQGRYVEMSAVTDLDTPIKTGTTVLVTGVLGGSSLVVRPAVLHGSQPENKKGL